MQKKRKEMKRNETKRKETKRCNMVAEKEQVVASGKFCWWKRGNGHMADKKSWKSCGEKIMLAKVKRVHNEIGSTLCPKIGMLFSRRLFLLF